MNTTRENWNRLAKKDPMWAIATSKRNWRKSDFYKTGDKAFEETLETLEFLGITIQKGKALDFGCGMGRITKAMAGYFQTVEGIDISDKMIELAKKNVKGCDFRQADNLKQEPSGIYDFIYSAITLQHNEPVIAWSYVIDFIRMLKPGGITFFDMPYENTGKEVDGEIPPDGLEMYAVELQQMLSVISGHRGRILAILNNKGPWPYWYSYIYIVERK